MTDDSGVRAIIYVQKADPDFAVFDCDVDEVRQSYTWDEFTPAGLVVAKDAAFALIAGSGVHVLLIPTGERLNAQEVMAGDGVKLGVTFLKLSGR